MKTICIVLCIVVAGLTFQVWRLSKQVEAHHYHIMSLMVFVTDIDKQMENVERRVGR